MISLSCLVAPSCDVNLSFIIVKSISLAYNENTYFFIVLQIYWSKCKWLFDQNLFKKVDNISPFVDHWYLCFGDTCPGFQSHLHALWPVWKCFLHLWMRHLPTSWPPALPFSIGTFDILRYIGYLIVVCRDHTLSWLSVSLSSARSLSSNCVISLSCLSSSSRRTSSTARFRCSSCSLLNWAIKASFKEAKMSHQKLSHHRESLIGFIFGILV